MAIRFGSTPSLFWSGGCVLLGLIAAGHWLQTMSAAAQEGGTLHTFNVRAHKYAFDPPHIEVFQGDLVRVTLRAEDIAHSFTVDAYRISKRAGAGETVTFEFRAETPGRFPFYCDLRTDDGCRQMKGELVVRAR
jgi:heme/copper-type cytochrome/quinol oxidase subunit 2